MTRQRAGSPAGGPSPEAGASVVTGPPLIIGADDSLAATTPGRQSVNGCLAVPAVHAAPTRQGRGGATPAWYQQPVMVLYLEERSVFIADIYVGGWVYSSA